MGLPVLIVDDSAMARKAALMFLDLTMPVMDGFGVLETLRREQFEVVVSSETLAPILRECGLPA
ncbi:MAG TPA: hypothetical protein VIS77_06305 [Burkholderiales bacterium]